MTSPRDEPSAEKRRLETIASDSWYAKGVNTNSVEYSFQVFSRFLLTGSILELGPAEGVMTPMLAKHTADLTLVEGAPLFCEDLRRRFPEATVVNSLFEDYHPSRQFTNIILGHVLEHVDDPVRILTMASGWLPPGGRILAAVPNARSLHRQAAVLMGMLPSEDALNEMDQHHGHRRVFGPESFRNAFLSAGLKIHHFGGYWLKPVSNRQIEDTWTPNMLGAFMALGERYPDIAGEIYVIATTKTR